MKSLLFVDFSNQVYKAAASHPGLSFAGKFTGGLYGVIVALCKIMNEVKATRVVVCKDCPPYLRKLKDSRYKSDRSPMEEQAMLNAQQTKTLVTEMLDLLQIPIWEAQGFESDDLIAWGAANYRHRFDLVSAASNDSDLFQLLTLPNFQIHRGKKGIYKKSDFVEEFGDAILHEWVEVLSLAGTHNAVPGIPGVGVKTAIKLLRDRVARMAALDRGDFRPMVEANRKLIVLPHPEFRPDASLRITKPKYDERSFLRFISKLGITLIPQMREALDRISEAE